MTASTLHRALIELKVRGRTAPARRAQVHCGEACDHTAMHALHMHNTSSVLQCGLQWLHKMMLSHAFLPEAVAQ